MNALSPEAALAAAGAIHEPIKPPRLQVVTGAALMAMSLPPRELVLAPFLPAKGLAMCYGPRGIGKTHLTLGCAFAIASGGTFLRFTAPRPRRVLVLDGEMPANTLQERLRAIADTATTKPPEAGFLRLLAADMQQERGLDLSNEADQLDLEQVLDGAEVLIVDNISTLVSGGKENEGESWLPVQQWALGQRRRGRSVLFMHHAGKGGQQRGTSRREDVLDSVLALRTPSDYDPAEGARFELHFEKSRGFHGDDAKPFEASLSGAEWTTRDLAQADMNRVAQLTAEGLSVRDIAEELGFTKSRVSRLQVKAREAGDVTRGPDGE